MKTGTQAPEEEQVLVAAPAAAVVVAPAADLVIEEDPTPALHTYTHQLDSLIVDEEALACLLSPGDQFKSLPGPPPPSPEVPLRTIPVLSGGSSSSSRSFDTEVRLSVLCVGRGSEDVSLNSCI